MVHIIDVSFGIAQPNNFQHMFTDWLGGTKNKLKQKQLI